MASVMLLAQTSKQDNDFGLKIRVLQAFHLLEQAECLYVHT